MWWLSHTRVVAVVNIWPIITIRQDTENWWTRLKIHAFAYDLAHIYLYLRLIKTLFCSGLLLKSRPCSAINEMFSVELNAIKHDIQRDLALFCTATILKLTNKTQGFFEILSEVLLPAIWGWNSFVFDPMFLKVKRYMWSYVQNVSDPFVL